MKKHFISMACILTALVSCQKNAAPEQTPQENQPIKVTLTATIGGDDTKVSFVDEDNVLKTAWEVGDKISVLSVNNGYLISNDVFVAKNAGKIAEFNGTFTNDPNTTFVYVYYPALTEGEGTVEKPYMSKPDNGSSYGVLNDFYLYQYDDYNSMYFSILDGYYLQNENADPSHISNQMIMMGEAEMHGNDFTTELGHLSYVIKATMTLPSDGYSVNKMDLASYKSDGSNANVTATDWQYFGSIPENHNLDNTLQMSFGDAIENSYGEGTGWTLVGNTLTVYIVGHGEKEIAEGNYWEISVPSYLDGESYHLVGKKEFPAGKTLEPGKMYRLNLELEPES